jgi:hypothetical protein
MYAPCPPYSGGTPLALACELQVLRRRSGLTLREVAVTTRYSVGTCTAASRGKQLPTWDVTAAYTAAGGAVMTTLSVSDL